MKKAIFLDRDGVINELVYNKEQGIVECPLNKNQISLVFGIIELLKVIRNLGFLIVVISNQPIVALNKTTLKNLQGIKKEVENQLEKEGVRLDKQYYCLHHPFAKKRKYKLICNCRKPGIGLIKLAAKELDIDLNQSWMIGDGVDDIKAGKNAGCKTILLANLTSTENLRIIENQLGKRKPDFMIKKLPDAIDIIN